MFILWHSIFPHFISKPHQPLLKGNSHPSALPTPSALLSGDLWVLGPPQLPPLLSGGAPHPPSPAAPPPTAALGFSSAPPPPPHPGTSSPGIFRQTLPNASLHIHFAIISGSPQGVRWATGSTATLAVAMLKVESFHDQSTLPKNWFSP